MAKNDVVLEKMRSVPVPWTVTDLSTATGIYPGPLYAILAALEAQGKVKSDWESGPNPRRRRYEAVS